MKSILFSIALGFMGVGCAPSNAQDVVPSVYDKAAIYTSIYWSDAEFETPVISGAVSPCLTALRRRSSETSLICFAHVSMRPAQAMKAPIKYI